MKLAQILLLLSLTTATNAEKSNVRGRKLVDVADVADTADLTRDSTIEDKDDSLFLPVGTKVRN